ncbi:cobalt/nickel transport system ATP-binding protein [Desulfotomaculum arcticum]|uniref:ABC transporter ATP-binding protein n=1 Tax=Desulfotruncus arcticus DSM 17038 TaxID=1121424 RepID=A0A1I2Q7J2_9FIRM|nr:ATP-binding cassette domain-containing protein [Desulfotruncus arcticus]SFG24268.1 cobalt/nickel transport system ATP-binding protein [Desulfotomaculum arcticum] [Desulfotruncus arcticus DSM 17038]
MTQNIIEVHKVLYTYSDGTNALNGITMKIQEGQKIAVLGANGAGKSTLFLHFNGILRPKRGQILFQGNVVDYRHRSLLELRKNIGIVFQDPDSQLFSASVLQDVAFGPLNLGWSREMALAKCEQAMQETEIEDLKNKPTHFLSYGQKKRVAIAGVLAMEPQVIIFDEPMAGLDPQMTQKIMNLLQKLSQQGKTLIISTHDVDLAYGWADYIFLIKDGTILSEGTPGEIFLSKELLHRCGLQTTWIIDIYRELVTCGLLAGDIPLPRDQGALLKLIKNASTGLVNV